MVHRKDNSVIEHVSSGATPYWKHIGIGTVAALAVYGAYRLLEIGVPYAQAYIAGLTN